VELDATREQEPRPDLAQVPESARDDEADGPTGPEEPRLPPGEVRALDLLVLLLALNGLDAGLPLLAFLALVVACRWVFTWRPETVGLCDGARVVGAWALPLFLGLLATGLRRGGRR
jgi:hypothetical protein